MFTESYYCHRSGKPKVRANPNRRYDPIPCECSSYTTEDRPSMVTVTYNWKHVGHIPGSIEDLGSAPVSRNSRLALQQLVENKMNWKNIKHFLRPNASKLATILEAGDNAIIEESMRLSYQSVYHAMGKFMKKCALRDPLLNKSLALWGEALAGSGGQYYAKNLDTMNDGMFLFAFGTKWQLDCLRKDGRIVCMDSTHKTCVIGPKRYCYLYTLVVRSSITGKGQPLCFMITNHAGAPPVEYWLKWLRYDINFTPQRCLWGWCQDPDLPLAYFEVLEAGCPNEGEGGAWSNKNPNG
ncbi:hypothetical protein BC941DRAFT_445310 [Chlamydoabsidia padenii]|nr:hypothetical protein BC941DRAFT_445310 [Chlamydoabsidia padenii]